jgi:glutamate racemase
MIGVFDSGIGGLTVVKELSKKLPNYRMIYFGDTAHLPYGTKSKKAVREFSDQALNFLIKQGAKIILIACNTSSAQAADYLRKKHPGTLIVDVISPALDKIKKMNLKKIGLIATPGTIKSKTYQKKLKKMHKIVISQATPLLVPFIEEGIVRGDILQAVLKIYLKPFEKNIDGIILGCTHYPLIEKSIKNILPKDALLINPSKIIVERLIEFLKNNKSLDKKLKQGHKYDFFVSDDPYKFETLSRLALGKKIKAQIVRL